MPVTPVGSLSEPMVLLRNTLAACAAFQTRVSAADAEEAKASIFYGPLVNNAGLSENRPFACMVFAVAGANEVADGVQIELDAGGGILLRLEDNAQYPDSDEDSYIDFLNFVGQTLDQLKNLAGYDDNFPMSSYQVVLPPDRTERTKRTRDAENDYWVCVVQIHFGNE